MDNYSIIDQIKIISETTVLLGVHGAGLAYSFLLRPLSTVIEIFPSSYSGRPKPATLCKWPLGGSVYYTKKILDTKYSDKEAEWITVPVEYVISLLEENKVFKKKLQQCQP